MLRAWLAGVALTLVLLVGQAPAAGVARQELTITMSDGVPIADHERDLGLALDRWHRLAPTAACLVIGPSDWPRERAGTLVPRPRTTAIRDAYRRAAFSHDCAFFDLLAFQGGPGAITRFQAAGWALPDHVHMTDEAHARLAEILGVTLDPPN